MLFKNIALLSLAALVAANEAAPVEAATTLVAVPASEDSAETPEDIKKLMHKKCPQEKCPKPKHVTLTKNITKVAYKTVTKTADKCQPTQQQKKCGGKNC